MQGNINTKAEQITRIPGSRKERDRLVKRYGDFQVTVARNLGVNPVTVNKIWQRRESSKRIVTAILEELNRRIQAEQTKTQNESAA